VPEPEEFDESTKVGAHELIAKIGEGGMSVVHLAQAPDGLPVGEGPTARARIACWDRRPDVVTS